MAKKYYWLKLRNDWFGDKRIKKLRSIAGGDTYTIIYLKMQLLSLKNEGKLFFEGVEDDFVSELALDLDEEVENVKITVSFLMKNGMLELNNTDEYLLTEVPETIGSETAGAERVRKFRNNKKALQCKESETLADAVCQTHKTWEKCFKYIMDQARKLKSGNCAMVKDSVVYEWAEDYYRLDDKALEEKKAVEAKEREKKQKADQQKRLDGMKKRAEKKAETAGKDKAAKETPKPEAKADKPKKEPEKKEAPKKRSNELEGQMDLFSMMGL